MTPDKVEEIVEKLWRKFKSVLGHSSIDAKNNSMHDLENFVRQALLLQEQTLTQYHQDLMGEVVEKIEKLDSYWRHPMALFPKDRTAQEDLKEMKLKDDIIKTLTPPIKSDVR